MTYEKMLLEALNAVVLDITARDDYSSQDLVKAVELNEALLQSGNTFTPADLKAVAASRNSEAVMALLADDNRFARAKAMYTTKEAMSIDDVTFRIHQLLHYFSTYGLEELFGQEVSHGWLPHETAPVPEKDDIVIRNARVLEVIPKEQKYIIPYTRIVSRRNRATHLERDILKEAISHLTDEQLTSVAIPFKENLYDIFEFLIDNGHRDIIRQMFPNTTDILKSAREYLLNKDFHLTTSQKKAIVKVFEQYDIADFKENIMRSNKVREQALLIFQYLDYNRYSRSPEHREAVRALRNDELSSWEGREKKLLAQDLYLGLQHAAQRPGMLLRQMNWLMKLGIPAADILKELDEKADRVSFQTLLDLASALGSREERLAANKADLISIVNTLIKKKVQLIAVPFAGKKVHVEEGDYDFDHSQIQFNARSDESGYITSGLAFRIPDDAAVVRNFIYWENDTDGGRVDIDTHFYVTNLDGTGYHLGWNDEHNIGDVYFSGDVTHSDPYGCEFMDLEMNSTTIENAVIHIHSYTGQYFKDITNFLVAVTAVSKLGLEDDRKLYNKANAYFAHELRSQQVKIDYGFINVPHRYIKFIGKDNGTSFRDDYSSYHDEVPYSLNDYLNDLLEAQGCERVSRDQAEVILRLDKPQSDNEYSLLDNNYFVDASLLKDNN